MIVEVIIRSIALLDKADNLFDLFLNHFQQLITTFINQIPFWHWCFWQRK